MLAAARLASGGGSLNRRYSVFCPCPGFYFFILAFCRTSVLTLLLSVDELNFPRPDALRSGSEAEVWCEGLWCQRFGRQQEISLKIGCLRIDCYFKEICKAWSIRAIQISEISAKKTRFRISIFRYIDIGFVDYDLCIYRMAIIIIIAAWLLL